MKDGNEPQQDPSARKPQQQTDERHGSIKRGQMNDQSDRARADLARGSEPETRAAGSRRG